MRYKALDERADIIPAYNRSNGRLRLTTLSFSSSTGGRRHVTWTTLVDAKTKIGAKAFTQARTTLADKKAI